MTTVCKRKKMYPVLPDEGRKILFRRTAAEAEIYEQLGVWRREYDTQTGELLSFRLVGSEINKVDGNLSSIRGSTSISEGEMRMNTMHSRTFGMREEERLQRIKDGLPPEDEIERTRAKIRVYPLVGSAVGAILHAWPR